MSTEPFVCAKCSKTDAPRMKQPPFRAGTKLADLGAEVQSKICAGCYREWIDMSVKLVNEMRLDTTDPRGQALWLEQMKNFLNLSGGSADPWARFLNQRVKIETTEGVSSTATLVGSDPNTLNLAEFEGGAIPKGFAASTTGAKGSASIARDRVRTLEAAT